MNKRFFTLCLVFITFSIGFSMENVLSQKEEFKKVSKLTITNALFFDIDIVGSDNDVTTLEYHVDGSENLKNILNIELKQNGQDLKMEVMVIDNLPVEDNTKGLIKVSLPKKSRIFVENNSGNISVSNVNTSFVDIITMTGDVSTSSMSCTRQIINTFSGNIDCYKNVGGMFINSGEGYILINDFSSGRIELNSQKGDIRVTNAYKYDNSLKAVTSAGTIFMNQIDGAVNAKSITGNIYMDSITGGEIKGFSVSGLINFEKTKGYYNMINQDGDIVGTEVTVTKASKFINEKGNVLVDFDNKREELGCYLETTKEGKMQFFGRDNNGKYMSINGKIKITGRSTSGNHIYK